MNIVIIGAGDIGLHLARILSEIDYGIVLIDKDPHKLALAARDLDVVTRVGSGSDWELLEELKEFNPYLLIALTNDDEINLVACTIAKNLGYPQTIARVRSPKYFIQSRIHFERLFSVDYLINPEKLTADAIANMIFVPHALSVESFSHGAVQMRTFTLPQSWDKNGVLLKKRHELGLPFECMVALIRRQSKTGEEQILFPHGDDALFAGDEVTFIGETNAIESAHRVFDTPFAPPQSVVLIGGSLIAFNLAKNLEKKGMRVTILEKEETKCRELAEKLPNTTLIHHDGADYRFLQTERLYEADSIVACTRSDETNFLAAAVARDLGAKQVIISLVDTNYFPLLKTLGIYQAASPRIQTANRLFSIVREKSVASMVSMYENRAEIMEVKVSIDSKITGIPIKVLGPKLPKDLLIAVIQNRGRIFIADGSRVLSPGDTVIVITNPRHMKEIKNLF